MFKSSKLAQVKQEEVEEEETTEVNATEESTEDEVVEETEETTETEETEETVEDEEEETEEDEEEETSESVVVTVTSDLILLMFHAIDIDDNNFIDYQEFYSACTNYLSYIITEVELLEAYTAFYDLVLAKYGDSELSIAEVFMALDTDADGALDFEDFYTFVISLFDWI